MLEMPRYTPGSNIERMLGMRLCCCDVSVCMMECSVVDSQQHSDVQAARRRHNKHNQNDLPVGLSHSATLTTLVAALVSYCLSKPFSTAPPPPPPPRLSSALLCCWSSLVQ